MVTICAFISSGGGGLDDMVLMSLLCSLLCCDFRVGLGGRGLYRPRVFFRYDFGA